MTKAVLKKTSNAIFNMKKVDLMIVTEQVNYYFSLIFPERNCNHGKVIVVYSKKMKAKFMKEDV